MPRSEQASRSIRAQVKHEAQKIVEFAAYHAPLLALFSLGALHLTVLAGAIYSLFTASKKSNFSDSQSELTSYANLMVFIFLFKEPLKKLSTMAVRFGLNNMPRIAPDNSRERFFWLAEFYANLIEDAELLQDIHVEQCVYEIKLHEAYQLYQRHLNEMRNNSATVAGNNLIIRQLPPPSTIENPDTTGLPPESLQVIRYVLRLI